MLAPGGLADEYEDVSQTIKDTLRACEILGERYLWVDALCIKQDDKKEKKEQTANMSSVYGAAVLAIVACAGSSVNAGVPEVEEKPISYRFTMGSIFPAYQRIFYTTASTA